MSGRTLTFIRGAAIGFTPVVWGWSLLDWQWWVFFICSNIALYSETDSVKLGRVITQECIDCRAKQTYLVIEVDGKKLEIRNKLSKELEKSLPKDWNRKDQEKID